MSCRRGWVVPALAFVLAACAQTDVIAREAADAGTPSGACRAAACVDFAALSGRCADPSAHLSLGDGCSAGDPTLPAARFAVCTCHDFVSTHALVTDAWDSRSTPGASTLSASVGKGDDCACGTSQLLDVAALVTARAADNDDVALGFAPGSLEGFSAQPSDPPLALVCGRYYSGSVHGSGVLRMSVTGHALLFVDGDLSLDDDLDVTLADGAALDLFVAGNVRLKGKLTLGDPAHAPFARLYVGGTGTIDIGGAALLAGSLYAPRAELVTRGPLEVYGSLFVRRAAPLAAVTVHYDVAQSVPNACARALQ